MSTDARPNANLHVNTPVEDEENDDELRGRILSRREVVALMGGGALAFLTGAGCSGGSSGLSSSGVSTRSLNSSFTATPSPTATSGSSASNLSAKSIGGKPVGVVPTKAGPTATPTATPTKTPTPTATPKATATPVSGLTCVVRPELTEGPYFVDEKVNRSDIRTSTSTGATRPGTLLKITFNVGLLSGGSCSALSGALVDVWHCDGVGLYSDISSAGTSQSTDTTGLNFLRGYQIVPSNGQVTFTTIYPGWYSGRAVHIHFKIRATISGKSYEFTSQLFFNDSLSTQIYAASAPYNTRNNRDKMNSSDGIYQQSGGQTLLSLTGSTSAGYSGTINVALSV